MISADRNTALPPIIRHAEPPGQPLVAEPVPEGSVHCGDGQPWQRQAITQAERQSLHPVVLEEIGKPLEGQSRAWMRGERVAWLESRVGFAGSVGGGGLKKDG